MPERRRRVGEAPQPAELASPINPAGPGETPAPKTIRTRPKPTRKAAIPRL
jgi:hypothetical protein